MFKPYLTRLTEWVSTAPIPFLPPENRYERLIRQIKFEDLSSHMQFIKKYDGGFPLSKSKVQGTHVVVLGGYLGDSAQRYLDAGAKTVTIFEPVTNFTELLLKRFKSENSVEVVPKAAWVDDQGMSFNINRDMSGMSSSTGTLVHVESLDFSDWIFKSGPIGKLCLEVNIEGSEYALLNRLLDTNAIKLFETIAIQFHNFNYGAELDRAKIRSQLRLTHSEVENFPWIWELWELVVN